MEQQQQQQQQLDDCVNLANAHEYYFAHFNQHPLPPSPEENVVFGSLLVTAQSNTPYTDATQVSQVRNYVFWRGLVICTLRGGNLIWPWR